MKLSRQAAIGEEKKKSFLNQALIIYTTLQSKMKNDLLQIW